MGWCWNVDNSLSFVRGQRVTLPVHKDAVELEGLQELADRLEGPMAIDLFCGAGGMSLGLQDAGFNVILGVDKNAESAATHRAYFPGSSIEADLTDPSTIDQITKALSNIKIDLVAGSPPCQSFSRASQSTMRFLANKPGGTDYDPRRDLWLNFLEIVERISPRAIMMENVPDLCFGKYTGIFRQQISSLEKIGYNLYPKIVAASDYGTPQLRQRLIIIGLKDAEPFHWPQKQDEPLSLRDAIDSLPTAEPGDNTNPKEYNHRSTTALQRYFRRGVKARDRKFIFDHLARRVRADDLEAYKTLKSEMNYADLPNEIEGTLIKRYRSDIFKDKYNRLSWDQPSRTITAHIAKDGYWYIHPEEHRTLTVREAARIQSFPDWFRFDGYPTSQYRQIGEAVPPILAREIGKVLLGTLSNADSDETDRGSQSHTSAPVPSSLEIARILDEWSNSADGSDWENPWRKSGNYWQNLLGMIVFTGLPSTAVKNNWPSYGQMWDEAEGFMDDREQPRYYGLVALGRGGLHDQILELAKLIAANHPDAIDPSTVANRILKFDGMTPAKIEEARMLSSLTDVVVSGAPPRRMASRLYGEESWESDSHGRMILSRALGDATTGVRYGAFLEVSERFCTKDDPLCGICPLNEICLTGMKTPRSDEPQLTFI